MGQGLGTFKGMFEPESLEVWVWDPSEGAILEST
jgi:hypothetical protein